MEIAIGYLREDEGTTMIRSFFFQPVKIVASIAMIRGCRKGVQQSNSFRVAPSVPSRLELTDAEAIAEAVQRPTMRFVPIKTESNWICRPCIACASAG